MKKITREQRNLIVETYLRDPSKAQQMARALGLRANYAYRAAYERGVLPRLSRRWGLLQETFNESRS